MLVHVYIIFCNGFNKANVSFKDAVEIDFVAFGGLKQYFLGFYRNLHNGEYQNSFSKDIFH